MRLYCEVDVPFDKRYSRSISSRTLLQHKKNLILDLGENPSIDPGISRLFFYHIWWRTRTLFIGMTTYLWQERREVPGSLPDVTKKSREVQRSMPRFSTRCDNKKTRGTGIHARILAIFLPHWMSGRYDFSKWEVAVHLTREGTFTSCEERQLKSESRKILFSSYH
jgi:hypothetical protein